MTADTRSDHDQQRDTRELIRIIEHAQTLAEAMEKSSKGPRAETFAENLTKIMAQKNLYPTQLGKIALLSRSFLYQLCNGERIPSRDIVLRLALALQLSVDDTQRLLRSAQRGALYPRLRRDAIIIFALSRGQTLFDTDEQLILYGEAPLL